MAYRCKKCGATYYSKSALPNHLFGVHKVCISKYRSVYDEYFEEFDSNDVKTNTKEKKNETIKVESTKVEGREAGKSKTVEAKDDRVSKETKPKEVKIEDIKEVSITPKGIEPTTVLKEDDEK